MCVGGGGVEDILILTELYVEYVHISLNSNFIYMGTNIK